MIKLLNEFNPDDLNFKPIRKTATGSRIIDVDEKSLFQTCWLKILYDVEYSICVEADKITNILEKIDKKIISYASNMLNFTEYEITKMYRNLLRPNGDSKCFSIPILSNTILFDRHKNFYDKSEIRNVLKPGQNVRFIFSFKKIYFKDNEITFPLELHQIELA